MGVLLVAGFFLLTLLYIYLQLQPHWNRPREASVPQEIPRNIYIITASGLNPSHLSSYLYQHSQTPAIDYLAYDGIRSIKAFSTSTNSLSAHLSLLSGLYPGRSSLKHTLDHLLLFRKKMPEKISFMPEMLAKSGYRTAAFLADPELRYPAFFQSFFQKVATGDVRPGLWQEGYSLSSLSQIAREWIIENQSFPQFLLLNFYEPALPWKPPAPYNNQYQSYPYDGEIAALDEQVGLFVHLLKELDLFRKSIIVFTAPYANAPDQPHVSRYIATDTKLQIPILVAAPGLLPKHREYHAQISLVDILPTLWTLLERKEEISTDGSPLFRKGDTSEISRKAVYAEVRGLEALGFQTLFFQRDAAGNNWVEESKKSKLPDPELEADAGVLLEQTISLTSKDHPDWAADLLSTFEEQLPKSAAACALLGSLYLEAGNLVEAIKWLQKSGSIDGGARILPVLSEAYVANGEYEAALETMRRYEKTNVLSYYEYSTICRIHHHLQQYQVALEACNQSLELNPRFEEANRYTGMTYVSMGNLAAAENSFRKAIQADTSNPEGYRQLASVMLKTDRERDAIPYLRQLLKLLPEDYRAMLSLAEAHLKLGNVSEARRFLQDVILKAGDPDLVIRAKTLLSES